MGREVRMVPVDWEHPKDAYGRPIPLLATYVKDCDEYWKVVREGGTEVA